MRKWLSKYNKHYLYMMDVRIIHVDMDAFYASIRQRDFSEIRVKSVAVRCAVPRGVVVAASYEARKFGVHSAMLALVARRKCSQLIFQPHRFGRGMRSYNKFLAKLASDMRKPNGIFVIDPHQAEEFLMKLEIGKFFGIGEITAENLRKMGIRNGADLYARSLETMIWIFGKRGLLSFAESIVGK